MCVCVHVRTHVCMCDFPYYLILSHRIHYDELLSYSMSMHVLCPVLVTAEYSIIRRDMCFCPPLEGTLLFRCHSEYLFLSTFCLRFFSLAVVSPSRISPQVSHLESFPWISYLGSLLKSHTLLLYLDLTSKAASSDRSAWSIVCLNFLFFPIFFIVTFIIRDYHIHWCSTCFPNWNVIIMVPLLTAQQILSAFTRRPCGRVRRQRAMFWKCSPHASHSFLPGSLSSYNTIYCSTTCIITKPHSRREKSGHNKSHSQ